MFENIIVAVTSPTRNHEIDETSLKNHLEFLRQNGITSILSGGTTGEFFSLGKIQRQKLFELTRKYFDGKIIYNVSDCSVLDVKSNIDFAKNFGADGITLLPPFFFANAATDEIIRFFSEALSYSTLSCMLYNFTKHTQNKITPEILKAVSHAALKDSDRDETLIAHTPCYVCGGDSAIFDFYRKGAKGVVSVMANYNPALVLKIWQELKVGDFESAEKTQEEIREISAEFRKPDQIQRIKRAVSKIIKDYPLTNV